MKKYLFIGIAIFFTLFVFSCKPNNKEEYIDPNALCVISNVSEDGTIQSRSLEYTNTFPVRGVLLRYHSDGLVNPESSIFADEYDTTSKKFTKDNAFYIEYFEEVQTTTYETPYNYVIYVPDSIRQAYRDAGGTNPEYGNAFWWYIFQYCNPLDVSRNDWDIVINYLLTHRYNLNNASVNEVGSNWKESVINDATVAKDPEGKTLSENICFGHWYRDEEGNSVKAEKITYFEDGRRPGPNSPVTTLYKIFIPIELSKAYTAGSGRIHRDDEALIWYFFTYYNISIEEFRQAFEQGELGNLIESCYEKYGYIEPSAYKVNVKISDIIVDYELESVEDSKMIVFADFFYYLPESLKLEDGTIIEDSSRVYFALKDGRELYVYYPIEYVLEMKSETEKRGWGYALNGSEFWNFFYWFCNPSESDIDQERFKISIGMFKKLLEYRSYEGLQENY